jgi:putative methyltransferase (TIGR04325 family)
MSANKGLPDISVTLAGSTSRKPGASPLLRTLVHALEQKLPLLRALHRRVYERRFAQQEDFSYLYSGVYKDFRSAIRAIPPGARVGCDHPEVVERFALATGTLWPSDYAVLFWLSTLMPKGGAVFDLGGGMGRLFFCFAKYLDYPPDLTWTVCEVAAAAQRGTACAKENGQRLLYTTRAEDAANADILIASGSLQLIETPLWDTLSRLPVKPPHLLINRVPLYEGTGFVTLFNMGPAIAPCQIWNRDDFIKHLEDCGYSLIDRWSAPELSCSIPFHPERPIAAHTGLYLKCIGATTRLTP